MKCEKWQIFKYSADLVDMMKKRAIFVLLLIFAVFLIGCSSYPGQEAVGLKLKGAGVTTTTLMDNTNLLQRMDANKDGVIDSKDVQAFSKGAKNKNMAFDFNNDKKVNSNDLKILKSNLGKKVNVIKATSPTSTSTLPIKPSIIEPMLVSDVKDLGAFSPYTLTIVPMYRTSLGKFIPFGSYATWKYIDWAVFSDFPRPDVDSSLLLYLSNSEPIISKNLMVSLDTDKGVVDIYVPELQLSEPHVQDYYFTKERTTGLFLYVDKKGLTYYARKDHGFGYPDLEPSEALQNEHLAVQSLAGYNLQRFTLDLTKNNEILYGDWKIKLSDNDNNLEMGVFIGDSPIKGISPITKSLVYKIDYADKTFWFRLDNFDVANKRVEYTSSFPLRGQPKKLEERDISLKNNQCIQFRFVNGKINFLVVPNRYITKQDLEMGKFVEYAIDVFFGKKDAYFSWDDSGPKTPSAGFFDIEPLNLYRDRVNLFYYNSTTSLDCDLANQIGVHSTSCDLAFIEGFAQTCSIPIHKIFVLEKDRGWDVTISSKILFDSHHTYDYFLPNGSKILIFDTGRVAAH